MWYQCKDKRTDQWNRGYILEIGVHTYCQLIFDKVPRYLWGRDKLFNKWCWKDWISVCVCVGKPKHLPLFHTIHKRDSQKQRRIPPVHHKKSSAKGTLKAGQRLGHLLPETGPSRPPSFWPTYRVRAKGNQGRQETQQGWGMHGEARWLCQARVKMPRVTFH